MIRYESVYVFLALSTYFRLTIYQMNVDTVFLNSKLEENVYVGRPPSFISNIHPDWIRKLSGGM